ncbi:glycoside hydrolase family 108 protein [Endozoicomonas arenosclerae]|uniref:glycoside hydrolase family 108 protein n=1 Tax=Endozoicomonas arenosclerae TaxID=1633495 RepID=UPI000784FD79|nr:glycosyl hydrolase 108 family protein [Endozoicomonas arenosclerae]
MALFDAALASTLKSEGGYVNDPADPGGETFQGITRTHFPKWQGWVRIDLLKNAQNFPANLSDDDSLKKLVHGFYQTHFWDRIQGDDIENQEVAESIFDFAVNAGTRTSSKLAQITCGETADGVIGDATLRKLNAEDPKTFLAVFALSKISRYVNICEQRQESRKFFYGWVRRTLEGL